MTRVSGFILRLNETGAPALAATGRAVDKDVRFEARLGEIEITETSGRYETTYTADQFRRADKRALT